MLDFEENKTIKWKTWRFPKMVVPLNHPFWWDVPSQTIHLGVSPFMETPTFIKKKMRYETSPSSLHSTCIASCPAAERTPPAPGAVEVTGFSWLIFHTAVLGWFVIVHFTCSKYCPRICCLLIESQLKFQRLTSDICAAHPPTKVGNPTINLDWEWYIVGLSTQWLGCIIGIHYWDVLLLGMFTTLHNQSPNYIQLSSSIVGFHKMGVPLNHSVNGIFHYHHLFWVPPLMEKPPVAKNPSSLPCMILVVMST